MSTPEIAMPSDRSFGLTFVVVFLIIAAWQGWAGRSGVAYTFLGLALAILTVAFTRPALLHGLNRAWMRFGALLHNIVNPIVLGGIYFLVFTPVAVVMRLAGRDALRRKLDTQAKSYWIDRDPPGPPPDSLPNQF
jgi:Saxitoxin biosynthesis operon protein SxtJ